MKKYIILLILLLILTPSALAEDFDVWTLMTEEGTVLTYLADQPSEGDVYISADNHGYEVVSVSGRQAVLADRGEVTMPSLDWMDADGVLSVAAVTRRIALYCTHSDECYEPTDGHYSVDGRGTIYEVADALAQSLRDEGIDADVARQMHHPHDAGAYRRSRQTAVSLLKDGAPDCLLDIHRDGIPAPDSYAVTLNGQPASKVRLLVGRGNQNADVNKEFALLVKAVGDRLHPGLIKDIYMGKGTFNQDLLPHSLLLECGTYTLDRSRVLTSMPLMAEVIDRALYGGIVGSAGRTVSDVSPSSPEATGGVTPGATDVPLPESAAAAESDEGVGTGLIFVAGILIVGLIGYGILSAGSVRGGMHKAARGLSEMTGGLLGKKPDDGEDPEHS